MQQQTSGRTLALVTALVAVALMLVFPVRSWFSQQSELASLEAEIDDYSERVAELENQKELWQDPVYVEEQARRRMNMVRPGEAGLIVLEPEETEENRPEPLPDTWYGKVWESVEVAAGRRPASGDDDQ